MRSSCEMSPMHQIQCRPCQRPCPTQKRLRMVAQSCSLSVLPPGKCDLFPFLPFLIVKRFPTPRFMNAAIVNHDDIVPLALFEVEFKSAVVSVGIVHHEESAELVSLRQSQKVVSDNGANGVNFTMLGIKVMAEDIFLCLLVEIRIGPYENNDVMGTRRFFKHKSSKTSSHYFHRKSCRVGVWQNFRFLFSNATGLQIFKEA